MASELDNELKPLSSIWWMLVISGMISLAIGIFFVVSPDETLTTFTVIAGIVLLIEGFLAILGSIFGRGEGRGLLAMLGVLSAIGGIILIKHPFSALVVFVIVLGIWFVASGIVRLIGAFGEREGRGANFALAAIDLVAGAVILAWPDLSLSSLAVIIGIVLIVRGLATIFLGFALHGAINDFESSEAAV